MISESVFLAALERTLNVPDSPVRVDRINSGEIVYTRGGATNRFRGAREGTGDLVGWVIGTGVHLEIETKAKKGRARTAQRARQIAASRMGWVYVSVRAGDELEPSVAGAVEAVHGAIAYRDLRPSNVISIRRARA